MLSLIRYIKLNSNAMNKKQNFYNTSLFWLFLLVIIIIPLLSKWFYSFLNDSVPIDVSLYFVLPLTVICSFFAAKGFKTWRRSNISFTKDAFYLKKGFKKTIIIPWENIKSIRYAINPTSLSIFLDRRTENMEIIYYDLHLNTHIEKIPLLNFFKYSKDAVFKKVESQYLQYKKYDYPIKKPSFDEIILYNKINNMLFIIITSVIVFLPFISLMMNQKISILITGIWIVINYPYSLYCHLLNRREIALVITKEGIQDQWLYKNNAFIPWDNVDYISISDYNNASFINHTPLGRSIYIGLIDHQLYLQQCRPYQRLILKLNARKYLTPFIITENLKSYSLDEVFSTLEKCLQTQNTT